LKLGKRIQIAIKMLLKENPMLPTSFKFGGDCLLEQLKREEKDQRDKESRLAKITAEINHGEELEVQGRESMKDSMN
jgi:hypothetical protein